MATIRVRMGSKMIYLERFQDLYFKDHIWAVKEVWQEKIKHTKMNNFLASSFLGVTPSCVDWNVLRRRWSRGD